MAQPKRKKKKKKKKKRRRGKRRGTWGDVGLHTRIGACRGACFGMERRVGQGVAEEEGCVRVSQL